MTEDTPRLRFAQPLVASPPITTKELLARLRALADELQALDQDQIDTASLAAVKSQLVSPKLLRHANAGVQAYACCCLADVLRLYAPDAPFTAAELTLMFKTVFGQFKKLADAANPYHAQQAYVLKRLAEARSAILVTDVPAAADLVVSLFEVLYSQEIGPRLEPLAADILSEVVAEAEAVPPPVLALVLERLMDEPVLGARRSGFAYSVHICDANVDRMSRQTAQYFSEMLYAAAGPDRTAGLADSLKKVHKLSVQIWKHVPGLLNSVMGLIDDELTADDPDIRALATETVGLMVGSSSHNFTVAHKSVWHNWLKKTLDAAPAVRCKWAESLPAIVETLTSSAAAADLANGLHKCLLDTNEKVRLTACGSIERIPLAKFTRHFGLELMATLHQLVREKNPDVRNRAIKILGAHFHQYQTAVSAGEVIDFGNKDDAEVAAITTQIFRQIPNRILSLIYINDKDINYSVDMTVMEKIVPLEPNAVKRADRLCQVYAMLDDKSKQALGAMVARQQQVAEVLTTFVGLVEQYARSGTLDEAPDDGLHERAALISRLDKTVSWLSHSMPDGLNSAGCFERFYKLKNFRLLHLVKTCVSADSDYKTVHGALAELLAKLADPKSLRLEDDKSTISATDMVSTFKLVLYRGAVLLYNRSNVGELVNYSNDPANDKNADAAELLESISKTVPQIFQGHVDELVAHVLAADDVAHALRTVYYCVRKSGQFPSVDGFGDKLARLCQDGSPLEARYAAKLLGLSPTRELTCSDVASAILPLQPGEHFNTHLSTAAELLLVDPISIEAHASDITATLIKDTLLVNQSEVADDADEDAWIGDQQLQNAPFWELNRKLLSLRFVTNRLRSLDAKSADSAEIEAIAVPIFKLFMTIIGNGGEIAKDKKTAKVVLSRLRHASGCSLLKLAKLSSFINSFTSAIVSRLIFLLQDQNKNIRRSFLNKLQEYLTRNVLPQRFVPLLFFMCNEPDPEIKFEVISWVKSYHKKMENKKTIKLEEALARLVHLVSHNAEFANHIDAEPSKAYGFAIDVIGFYCNQLTTAENISLLYYVSSRVKQYRDASIDQSLYEPRPFPSAVLNLYRVSEVAQLIIKDFSDSRGWPIQTWPGKVVLPDDIFAALTSAQEAQDIINTVYISDDLQLELGPKIKSHLTGGSKRKAADPSIPRKKARKLKTKKLTRPVSASSGPARKSNRPKKSISYAAELSSGESGESSESEFESDYSM